MSSSNLHDVPDEILEDLVYHPLEGDSCVLEFEGYHLVAVNSPTRGEACLIFIWRVDFNLIIIEIGVHEAKEPVACRGVTPRIPGYRDVTATYICRSKIPSRIYAKHQYR